MNCNLNCRDCLRELCMHKVPLFASLPYEELKDTAEQMTCCDYEKGQLLLAQGEVPQGFTVILSGSAKVYTVTTDGQEKVLSVLSENDYFGELFLFGNSTASYSVRALCKVRACCFAREHFQRMLLHFPAMAVRLVEELGGRVARLEEMLQNAAGGRAEARIAALLLEYAQKYSVITAGGPEIVLPLSREGMANYVGVARETMSRKLKQMEKDGLIASSGNKRLRLLKPGRLHQMAMGNTEER